MKVFPLARYLQRKKKKTLQIKSVPHRPCLKILQEKFNEKCMHVIMKIIFFVLGKLLIKKWKNIKDQYIKSLKKLKGKSGSAAKTFKKYIFSEQLSFLKSTLVTRETESSFDVDNSPESLDNEGRENDDSLLTEGPSTSAASHEKNLIRTAESTIKQPSSELAPKRKKIDVEREILKEL